VLELRELLDELLRQLLPCGLSGSPDGRDVAVDRSSAAATTVTRSTMPPRAVRLVVDLALFSGVVSR